VRGKKEKTGKENVIGTTNPSTFIKKRKTCGNSDENIDNFILN